MQTRICTRFFNNLPRALCGQDASGGLVPQMLNLLLYSVLLSLALRDADGYARPPHPRAEVEPPAWHGTSFQDLGFSAWTMRATARTVMVSIVML